jgi:glucose dehydrogenase
VGAERRTGAPQWSWDEVQNDSVMKLSPQGRLLWYYQLTPHDLYDWDLQNSPVLTTASGRPVVIAGGRRGIGVAATAHHRLQARSDGQAPPHRLPVASSKL